LNGDSAVSPGPYKEYLNAPVVPLEKSSVLINQMSFGDVLGRRRTTRKFTHVKIKFKECSELLLHTCGKVAEIYGKGVGLQLLKTSPSGGARHPVEAYIVAFNVEDLASGIYHYNCKNHSLECLDSSPDASLIWEYVHRQGDLVNASMAVFFTARWARHMWKYRYARSYRMVMFDVGHLVQTFILTATALGLRTFLTPAVSDSAIQKLLHIEDDLEESPLYCVAIG
jgi:SagB-type dehydrogenase family enzyme